jgi:ABC-type multidrug transport system permease subunit
MLLRVGAGLQVLVGLTLWTGHGYSMVGMHRAIGVGFVLVLWSIALLSLAARRQIGLALVALLWGFVIAALGFTQQRILIGDMHWIVRVLHLVIGLSAMPLAERLAKRE